MIIDIIMKSIEKEYSWDSSKKEIIRFGIQSGLEILVNVLTSILIFYVMDMFWEGIFFFLVFIPVRIFSGGYHAETFFRCWLLSSAILLLVLDISKRTTLSGIVSFILICVLCVLIWMIGAVINDNRPVSQNEYVKFLKKLHITMGIQIVLAIILIELQKTILINILICSLAVNLLSLIIGKVKYQNNNENSFV